MSNNNQKPEDQKPENDSFAALENYLRDSFDQAKANTGEALDVVSRGIRGAIRTGESAARGAYDFVESTVGKERVIGAVIGAKIGGTVGMAAGVPGMIKGGAVGTIAGFIGGRKFVEWYNRDKDGGGGGGGGGDGGGIGNGNDGIQTPQDGKNSSRLADAVNKNDKGDEDGRDIKPPHGKDSFPGPGL